MKCPTGESMWIFFCILSLWFRLVQIRFLFVLFFFVNISPSWNAITHDPTNQPTSICFFPIFLFFWIGLFSLFRYDSWFGFKKSRALFYNFALITSIIIFKWFNLVLLSWCISKLILRNAYKTLYIHDKNN